MARDGFGALLRKASSGGRVRPERSYNRRQLGSFDLRHFDLRHNDRTAEQQMSFADHADPRVLVLVARFFAAFKFQYNLERISGIVPDRAARWGHCAAGSRCADRENQGG